MIEVKEIILLFSLYIIILIICTSLRLIEENIYLRKSIEKEKKKRNCLRQLSLEANFSGVLFPSPRAKWLYEFK